MAGPGSFDSNTPGVAAVTASATAPGPGSNGVHGITSSDVDSAVYGEHRGTGIGVFGRGGPAGGEGVFGETNSGYAGVFGNNTSTSGDGVGVFGLAAGNGPGVAGVATEGDGVAVQGVGVSGRAGNGTGVAGTATGDGGYGVTGKATGDSGTGVYGSGGLYGVRANNASIVGGNEVYLAGEVYAGDFGGDVRCGNLTVINDLQVGGNLHKHSGGFRIDHPCDAAGKYLCHSFVESSDMKNIYDGIAVLDSEGAAEVALPSWFDALNADFRYQLTCIGSYAQVYIAQELQDNRFRIAGGVPQMSVSWQVTGVRKDPWASANRLPVEEEKPAEERGHYLHPGLYGEDENRHIASYAIRNQVRHR